MASAAAANAPFRALPGEFKAALHSFTQSPSSFRILRTAQSGADVSSSESAANPPFPPPTRLYILDSSFNPPTLGHLSIAVSALKDDDAPSRHLLLLLATQNADKASKPAAFEQRLTMMTILAESVLHAFRGTEKTAAGAAMKVGAARPDISVSIGMTKHPYFVDKSQAIASSSPGVSDQQASGSGESPFPFPPTRQVHLIGFDTFTRLLDTRYYPPAHTLAPLSPLFAHHAVRVTFRTGDGYGDRDAQRAFVRSLADGSLDAPGADPSWAASVTLVDGRNEEMVTSSTTAREAAAASGEPDRQLIADMCGDAVAGWVLDQRLYRISGSE